jgi:hypothetical protein
MVKANGNTGLCVDLPGTKVGDNVKTTASTCDGGTDQKRWSAGANLAERSGFTYSDAYGTAAY